MVVPGAMGSTFAIEVVFPEVVEELVLETAVETAAETATVVVALVFATVCLIAKTCQSYAPKTKNQGVYHNKV